ncbi:MAG: C40 family peptidase [Taibaiella sp.]|nr:C40 family peptidase [Taibaiella sp.]
MSPIPNVLNGLNAIIPGIATAPNPQPADNKSLFDHGDHVLMKYALMIDADPDELNDPSLYHFINQWYGVRYKWGGTTPKGIDCSALSQKMYESVYNVNIRRTSKQQYRHSDHFKRFTEAEEGDLVFFRINRMRISHVGIYLANGYFVHASRSKGVMISNLSEKYWKRRYAGCGRIVHEVRGDMESAFVD